MNDFISKCKVSSYTLKGYDILLHMGSIISMHIAKK